MPADHTVPARERPASRPGSRAKSELFLVATILASAMEFIDGIVVPIAVPEIQREFDTGLAGQQQIVGRGG